MVEIVSIRALLKTRDALILEERDYDRDPIIEVSGHVCKIVLTGRSVSTTKKGNKEGRSVMLVV
jgi:hypothetical protein